MTIQPATADSDFFRESILGSADSFAANFEKNLSGIFGVQGALVPAELCETGIQSSGNVFVSILFTGTVYGEFVLAADEETAAALIGKSLEGASPDQKEEIRSDIADAFSELLNLTVGESIVGLKNLYKKTTITAPKVHFGQVRYPIIRAGRAGIKTEKGVLDCYFYVDRMKLDISASYRHALVSLFNANKGLREALAKLAAQQDRLIQSEKFVALGTMAAGVAHEINTPLATISLLNEQVRERIQEATLDRMSLIQLFNLIEQTIAKISKITHALWVYTEAGKSGSTEEVDVKNLIDDLVPLCRALVQEHGVKFEVVPVPKGLKLNCKPAQIAQALHNMVKNAVDEVRKRDSKWIRLEVRETDDRVEFRLTDSGTGIPAKIRENIFDPFFTTKDFGQGMGLGLSFSNGVFRSHQGKIYVNAKSPHTEFVAEIPKSQKGSARQAG